MASELETLGQIQDEFQIDAWTPIDYKDILPTRYRSGLRWMAPMWVGERNRRRLSAYKALIAYRDNAARMLLRVENTEQRDERDARREYGDGSLLIETMRSACIGDKQTIVVDGADEYDPDAPEAEAQAAFEQQERLRKWAEDEKFT